MNEMALAKTRQSRLLTSHEFHYFSLLEMTGEISQRREEVVTASFIPKVAEIRIASEANVRFVSLHENVA